MEKKSLVNTRKTIKKANVAATATKGGASTRKVLGIKKALFLKYDG